MARLGLAYRLFDVKIHPHNEIGGPSTASSNDLFLVICMILVSLSIIIMAIFSCSDGADPKKDTGGGCGGGGGGCGGGCGGCGGG